ncbi:hypothetical protein TSOC_009249 [Tetrabaena socialis]|uniref:F-box domain-containing protein n=1 Tax=Tetrabaena socialis TaxID=47790 RepID=A0A2J7ZWC1_9CHLO|nr:hypothetical protein TSOC_009249 [Tetrabaena socialis]|eukprot:PNH04591.1 hypothetical protein TSOC_009249 [Tetrabaena socialis]
MDSEQRVDFAGLLRAMSLPAADALVASLMASAAPRGLAPVRLACRALRDLVDGSVLELRLPLRHADLERVQQLPSLARWPRANRILLDFDEDFTSPDEAPLLLAIPVLEAAWQRVTELTLSACIEVPLQAEVAVTSLAPRLMALRALDLAGFHGTMSYGPLQQRVMYGTLASMPCLESLVLPGCRSLDCIGSLAGSSSLRSLTAVDFVFANLDAASPSSSLSHQALAGIATLQRLRQLTLQCRIFSCGAEGVADAGLAELLASLPPSVARLSVGAVVPPEWDEDDEQGPQIEVSLQRGSVQSLKLSCDVETITGHHASALVEALLGWSALGPQLDRLELSALMFNDGDELRLPPLLELFGRCRQTKLQTLVLGLQASLDGAQRLLQLLPQADTVEVELVDERRGLAEQVGAAGDEWVESFRAVPPAAAVLLRCTTEGIAAAVVAAATAVATAAAATSATADVEAPVPGALLEVVVLTSTFHSITINLMSRVSEVAQEMLGGRHSAEAWGEQERVRCALQLWILLRELPDAVRVDVQAN